MIAAKTGIPRIAAALAALGLAGACVAGDAAPKAERFYGFDGNEPEDAVRHLPPGVSPWTLRIGNDDCYYYDHPGEMRPVLVTGTSRHYCRG
ncbi:hypothetical protein [Pseudogemmobacter sonorensis]|uniref:hypothetical protein n=1 Tax=Pseudogemmobacter sonorensis TaxID=2989681 RepID=UPI0036C1181F